MPSTRCLAFLLAISLALSASPAVADLVTFTFAGQIVRLDGDVGFLGGMIPVGTSFNGSYTFDSNTPDTLPGEPSLGNYRNALTTLSLQVGDYQLTGVNGSPNGIRVANDLDGSDSYVAGDQATPLLGRSVEVTMLFIDDEAKAFSDDSLPVAPFSLEPFEDSELLVGPPNGAFFLVGEISYLAPEPSAIVLLFPWLFVFLRRGRNARNRT